MKILPEKYLHYIRKDLESKGLIHEGLEDEIVDHISTLVENRMGQGKRFMEAYQDALKEFGGVGRIRQVQKETIQFENYKTKIMLQNYLKIAYRNIVKHRFYSMINILGLAIGIACCILILLYVEDETGYDKHLANSHRIYRVASDHLFHGNEFRAAVTPAPLASALINDFPEVEASARLRNGGSIVFRKGESAIKEPSLAYADSTFFNVFPFNFLEGIPETALVKPNSIVINQTTAQKYFGNSNAAGKTLLTSEGTELLVTAVIEDIPVNTHFQIPIFITMANWSRANNDNWMSNNFHTYLLLREGYKSEELEAKFPGMVEKYVGPQIRQFTGVSLEEAEAGGSRAKFFLQPVTSIHLESDLAVELGVNGDITYMYIFSSIAIFILIIACINFMNMSTARSAGRAKEVGIRKVLGSYRSHLIRQFLTESVILTLLAGILAFAFAVLALPYFNWVAGKSISMPFSDVTFVLVTLFGIITVGVLSGFYPSFILSAFRPAQGMKGVFNAGRRSTNIRSILVVFQFVISVVLILGTLVIYNQLNYIQHKNLGFEKDQVLVIRNAYLLDNNLEPYKNSLVSESLVSGATISSYLPAGGPRSDNTYFPKGNPELESGVNMQVWSVDHDYLKTFKMDIAAGRDFSIDFPSDRSALILNESAAAGFGFENPIGEIISEYYWDPTTGAINQDSMIDHQVIGVVRDFHFSSLRNNISPLCLRLNRSAGSISVRFNAASTSEIIDLARTKWFSLAPGQPFEYFFLDDQFNSIYSSEKRTGKIFATFAGLAIFVACLGLFILSAYTTERRTKEIGVRKVLGASQKSIIFLLSKEFGKLIVAAFIIAIPLGIYGMNAWLSQFAYKANPGIFTFLSAGLVALLVAFVTMSYQSFRAARTNPADSLRNE